MLASSELLSQTLETEPELEIRSWAHDFLNPALALNVELQQTMNAALWQKLGFDMPEISNLQYQAIASLAEANPSHRLVFAPLLDTAPTTQEIYDPDITLLGLEPGFIRAGRGTMSRNAQVLLPGFSARYDPLWAPDSPWRNYGCLLDEPEQTVQYGPPETSPGPWQALRYVTPAGANVGRQAFIAALIEGGHTVQATDGMLWILPLMDIQSCDSSRFSTIAEAYGSIHPLATVEVQIALQIMRELADFPPKTGGICNIANEAIYELDGGNELLRDIVTIDSYPGYQAIGMYAASQIANDDFCILR